MKLDARENNEAVLWDIYDKDTGRSIINLHIVAADDSTGQIVRYKIKEESDALLPQWSLVSEFRNIELVYIGWLK